jgi:hypothetical protein
LIYLTEEEFEFLKRLRGGFLKRAVKFLKRPRESRKQGSERPVEQRSLTRRNNVRPEEGFIYGREILSASWRKVKEYYREATKAERYEQLCREIKT